MFDRENSVCSALFGLCRLLCQLLPVKPAMAIVLKSSILLVLLGIAGSVQGQDGTREVLLHARQSVMDTLNRLPKYVCTQTIERSRYEPDRTPSAHWCDEVSVEPNRLGRRRLSSSD